MSVCVHVRFTVCMCSDDVDEVMSSVTSQFQSLWQRQQKCTRFNVVGTAVHVRTQVHTYGHIPAADRRTTTHTSSI